MFVYVILAGGALVPCLHNPHCRFSNKVNCSMRNMWEACIFYAEKDRGKAGWVNRRIWGVHAGLPAALCQWTGSHGNSKMCPGISQSWMYLSHIIWSTSLHSAFLLDEQDNHSTKAVTLYVQVVLVDSELLGIGREGSIVLCTRHC